jgi:hypothetical protein
LVACSLFVILGATGTASAAPVEVLGHDGRVHVVNNRFLPSSVLPAGLPAPSARLTAARARAPFAVAAATKKPTTTPTEGKPKPPTVTVASVLHTLELRGALTATQYQTYLHAWNAALSEEQDLSSTRRQQLADVTVLLHDIAASGQMTAARLPVLFLTLQRNAQWWTHGSMLSYGQRVQFAGSRIVWEYYPGEGIQLQVLGTFGEADGYYEAGKATYPALQSLMDEMLPLAVNRAGALTWEYYFNWDGGRPPWVSAMSQATAIEALTNAYKATHEQSYLTDAHRALPLLSTPPPAGVGVRTARGWRFLQYSFAPSLNIINAFLQSLIGLDSYLQVSNDPTAKQLFTGGNAEAEVELPRFNTGSWSLYSPGKEDDLSYHQLVTGFAQDLCTDTKAPIYCNTAAAFNADLKTPPRLTQVTQEARAGKPFSLLFKLSKLSKVGIQVTGAGVKSNAKPVVYTSADYPYGTDAIKVQKLKPGTYTVKLSATDLAGNYASLTGELIVYRGGTPPPTPPSPTSSPVPAKPKPTPTTTVTTPTPPPPTAPTSPAPGSGGVGFPGS